MAVGKGSMERAAKAAEKKAAPAESVDGSGEVSGKKTTAKKAASAGKTAVKKTASARKAAAPEQGAAGTVVEGTIAAPSEEVLRQIVYQESSGILERAAEPNERFGLGDAMPVYYF